MPEGRIIRRSRTSRSAVSGTHRSPSVLKNTRRYGALFPKKEEGSFFTLSGRRGDCFSHISHLLEGAVEIELPVSPLRIRIVEHGIANARADEETFDLVRVERRIIPLDYPPLEHERRRTAGDRG